MSKLAWTMIFVAVGAMLLPWQRCHDDCHDEITPLGGGHGGHGCHGDRCSDEPHDNDAHEGAEHEIFTSTSILPDSRVELDAMPAVAVDHASADVTVFSESSSIGDASTPATDVLETAVLLL